MEADGKSLTDAIRRMKWGQVIEIPASNVKTARNAIAALNGAVRCRSVWSCERSGDTYTVTKRAKNPGTQRMYERKAATGELKGKAGANPLLKTLLALEAGDTVTLKETDGRGTREAVRKLKCRCRPELTWRTSWSEERPHELTVRCVRRDGAASLNEAAIMMKCGRLTLSKDEAASIVGGEERLNALHGKGLVRIEKSGKGGNSRWRCNMYDVIRFATESRG